MNCDVNVHCNSYFTPTRRSEIDGTPESIQAFSVSIDGIAIVHFPFYVTLPGFELMWRQASAIRYPDMTQQI